MRRYDFPSYISLAWNFQKVRQVVSVPKEIHNEVSTDKLSGDESSLSVPILCLMVLRV